MTGLLVVCALLASPQKAVEFSNWRFQISPFWIQSNQGPNLILTPFQNAVNRNSRIEIRPGVKPTRPLEEWFLAEWNRILAGRVPTRDWGRKGNLHPLITPGLQQQADFRDANGKLSTIKLIVLNPPGSINSILYTA